MISMRSRVLLDHRLEGKTLVTPFNQQEFPLQEVSWKDDITPQVLWIALLHEFNGYPRGQEIALLLSRAARLLTDTSTPNAYYASSEYESISTEGWEAVRRNLRAYGCLNRVTAALSPLESFCQETPFSELLRDGPRMATGVAEKIIKSTVRRLSLRRDSWESTMVQYTVAKIAFASNKVKVSDDLALADLDAVDEYPRTEKLAATLRAFVTMMFIRSEFNPHVSSETWVRQFWHHCLSSTPCEY